MEEKEQSRYKQGLKKLTEVHGQAGVDTTAALGDLGRYIVEFAYGDIYSRQGLSLRERAIATMALLTALGGREPQLEAHFHGALNVGLTPSEIEEIILQTIPYAGFPTAMNAANLLKKVTAAETDIS